MGSSSENIPPVVTFRKHGSEVGSPVATNPAKALVEILGTILERGLYLGLFVVLHTNVPIVCVKPPSDEVVIVGVELACSPSFVGEVMRESILLEDATPISHGASGEAGKSAVDV